MLRLLWRIYIRVGLPAIGLAISRRWAGVGAFLGPSIERFEREHGAEVERYWCDAGLADIRVERMSFGAGVVTIAVKAASTTETLSSRRGPPGLGRLGRRPSARGPSVVPDTGAAFYALRPGGLRDYWTLLHPPYTAWHLSYVLLGAALAPMPDPRIVAGALVAFFLAVGIAAHSFDELQGRPLGTRIPSGVLVALGSLGLIGAVAFGVVAAAMLGPWFLVLVAIGSALVISYGLEVPVVHSDIGFALAWGGFPVVASATANGAPLSATLAAALGASLLSLAQRRLSTPVRRIRRKAAQVSGSVRYRDGTVEEIDAARLIGAPESALRLLWLAMAAIAIATLLARWTAA
jgi:hypothetical protein